MTYIPVEINYIFKLDKALIIGSGKGMNSYVDDVFKTRKLADNSIVYEIPGTSVKGHIRTTFEKLSHIFEVDATRIFGKERYAGWAHFTPLRTERDTVLLENYSNTSIDRYRKAAKAGALRVEEYITLKGNSYFTGKVEGFIEEGNHEDEIYSLLLAMLGTKRFGKNKSTGYGAGKIIIESCKIGDLVLEQSEINDATLKHFGEVSK